MHLHATLLNPMSNSSCSLSPFACHALFFPHKNFIPTLGIRIKGWAGHRNLVINEPKTSSFSQFVTAETSICHALTNTNIDFTYIYKNESYVHDTSHRKKDKCCTLLDFEPCANVTYISFLCHKAKKLSCLPSRKELVCNINHSILFVTRPIQWRDCIHNFHFSLWRVERAFNCVEVM